MLTYLSALLIIASADPTASRCSVAFPSLARAPIRDTYIVLDATPDSIAIPFTYSFDGGRERFSRTASPDGVRSRSQTVYGQVFRVREASGQNPEVNRGDAVVVIWWGLGLVCERVRPHAATMPGVHELFLLTASRPRNEWLDSTPLFDAWADTFMYSPQRPYVTVTEATPSSNPLAMTEFLDFFRLLPPRAEIFSKDSSVIAPLLRWADADPIRWTQYPVGWVLCESLWARERYTARCPSLMDQIRRADTTEQTRPSPRAP